MLSSPQEEGYTSSVVMEPAGVVGLVTPWNFPLMQAVLKIAPALAAGCTAVRPSFFFRAPLLLPQADGSYRPLPSDNRMYGMTSTGPDGYRSLAKQLWQVIVGYNKQPIVLRPAAMGPSNVRPDVRSNVRWVGAEAVAMGVADVLVARRCGSRGGTAVRCPQCRHRRPARVQHWPVPRTP